LRKVFVDTSAFVALRNRAEREHEVARPALGRLVAERTPLFTSSYVFAETYTALLVRLGRSEAIEWGRRFRASEAIELVRVEEPLDEQAWSLLESHADSRGATLTPPPSPSWNRRARPRRSPSTGTSCSGD
jgi:uncharacterized protein